MSLQFAAHVGHPIAHNSHSFASVVSGIVLAVGAGSLLAFAVTGGAPILIAGMAIEGVSIAAWGLWGGVAINAAKIVDSLSPPSNECEIIAGHPTVLLGPMQLPAARADIDTKVAKMHTSYMVEGSMRTMIGTFRKPMSRVGDHSECNGVISEGIHSIIVGGDPSAKGKEFEEGDPAVVYWGVLLTAFADGIANTREGLARFEEEEKILGALQAAQGTAEAGGQVAKVVGAPKVGTAGDVLGGRPFTGKNLQERLGNAFNAGMVDRDGLHTFGPHEE